MTKEASKKLIMILVVLLVSASMFLLPYEAMGLNLNPIQQGVVALFVFAALMWILEPIQIWTTSVLVIGICLLCLSNQAFKFLRMDRYDKATVYEVMDKVAPDRHQAMEGVKAKALAALDGKELSAGTVGEAIVAAAKEAAETADSKLKPMLEKVAEDFAPTGTQFKKLESVDYSDKAKAIGKLGGIIENADAVKAEVIDALNKAGSLSVKAVRTQVYEGYMAAAAKALKDAKAEADKEKKAGLTAAAKAPAATEAKTEDKAPATEAVAAAPAPEAATGAKPEAKAPAAVLKSVQLKEMAQDLQKSAGALADNKVDEIIRGMKFKNRMEYKSIMATFADPIIILFLGGFFLAAAATKYSMDINLAKVLLKPFGTNPKYVMLGLMSVTAIFAMFMSNTATAAMMLALLGPVIVLFKPEDRGRIAFALCIPLGANIGGIGTPIGTPPNAIAMKFMNDNGMGISFAKWMMFGVPYVIVMLFIAWFVLLKMFPIKEKSIELKVEGSFRKDAKAIIVYVTFAATVLLWVLSDLIGVDSNVIAIVPIVVFSITGVITVKDLKQMSWDVLWLVAGGFALGLALKDTGLAKVLIDAIPFKEWSPMLLMVGAGFICMFMSTFMSNTATANLLMPLIAAAGVSMQEANAITGGGVIALLITVGLSASLGLALPISTPPNALAYATGHIKTSHMAASGTIMSIIGLTAAIGLLYMLMCANFFG